MQVTKLGILVINLYPRDVHIQLCRMQHEMYNKDCIMPRVQTVGGGVNVWGIFHHGWKCDLVLLENTVNYHSSIAKLEHDRLV